MRPASGATRRSANAVRGDYYAILGVSPASEDVVIRAAYRALMRRYHPDTDPSGGTSDRARDINAAYAVLNDPEKRARYDGWLAAQGLIKPEPPPRRAMAMPAIPRPGPAAVGALGLFAALLILIAVSPPIAELPGAPAVLGSEGPAAPLASDELRPAAASTDAESLCSNRAAHGLVQRELFARAARLRGADGAGISAVGERALARVGLTGALGSGGGGASCTGWVAIDLPPGAVVDGGRSNLNAEVGFTLVPAGVGGVRLAALSGTEGLVQSLSSLARAPENEPPAGSTVELAAAPNLREAPPEIASSRASEPQRIATRTAEARAATASPARRRPTSGCAAISDRAARAICSSRNLAALDRHLVLFTGQSLKAADAQKKAALTGSSEQFRQKRDSCRSEACMSRAYLERMREVSEIMARP